MLIAVIALGFLLLALWTVAVWAVHEGWQLLATLPWDRALEQWRLLELPPWLEPMLGIGWDEWLRSLEPLLAWAAPFLQSSAGWLGGLVPVLLWVAWGFGALLLVGMTAALAGAVLWWRRREPRPA